MARHTTSPEDRTIDRAEMAADAIVDMRRIIERLDDLLVEKDSEIEELTERISALEDELSEARKEAQ